MRLLRFLLQLWMLASNQQAFAVGNNRSTAKPIIIDTDIMSDVDDVGALAIANVFHNCGLCDVKAVMVNTHSEYGALATSVINTYFGNGNMPIGAIRPLTNETFFDSRTFQLSDYASKIAMNFPRALLAANQTATPLDLYRSTLEEADDHSMTIISIGFLTNLAELLESEGGPELIENKVRELVVMGGQYPSGWEFNFGGVDPASTAKAISQWPRSVPVTFSGYELGGNVFSGHGLRDLSPADSPVLAAYEWYVGRGRSTRESWDPITVLYGLLGLDGFDKIGEKSLLAYANADGYSSIVAKNGSNAWVHHSSVTNQHWLRLADGVTNTTFANLLTRIYAHGPESGCCLA